MKRLLGLLPLFTLSALAFGQPLFSLLAQQPEFLIAHQTDALGLALLLLIPGVLLPLLLASLVWLVGLISPRSGRWVYTGLIGGLIALALLPIGKQVPQLPGLVVLVLSASIAILAAIAFRKTHFMPMFLTALSPAIVIVPLWFLSSLPLESLLQGPVETKPNQTRVESDIPIVMVVFDEFEITALMDAEQRINRNRYPNFARLAETATWYRNASTTAVQTTTAIPALLTGHYPEEGRVPTFSDYPDNLFTLLGEGKRSLVAQEGVTQLCPEAVCRNPIHPSTGGRPIDALLTDSLIVYLHVLLPKGLTGGLPPVHYGWGGFLGRSEERLHKLLQHEMNQDRVAQFNQFVNTFKQSGETSLYFLHSPLPHLPYQYLPSGKYYSPGSYDRISAALEPGGRWIQEPTAVNQIYRRYLLQVGFVDRLLGRLIQRLKAAGLYDRGMLIVTSDHGVSFRPCDWRRALTPTNLGDIVSVPLFIKYPHQHQGRISDRNVQTIDILPTVAEVVGIEPPWPTDGQSILSDSWEERPKKTIMDAQYRKRSVSLETVLKSRRETLQRKLALFGSGSKRSLPQPNHGHRLLGTSVTPELLQRARELEISLDHPARYQNVDPTADFLPIKVSGSIRSTKSLSLEELQLVVAVNGRIRAITHAVSEQGNQAHFSALLPQDALRAGSNEVRVLPLREAGSQTDGTTSPRNEERFELLTHPNAQFIRTPSGKRYRVNDAFEGYVDKIVPQGHGLKLLGWSADRQTGEIPKRVVVFLGKRFVASGEIGQARPDVAAAFDRPSLRPSGFELFVPHKGMSPTCLQVYALDEETGVASRLVQFASSQAQAVWANL